MKKRSWKADEMELSINFRAARAAHVFGIIEIQRTAAKMSQEKLKIKKA